MQDKYSEAYSLFTKLVLGDQVREGTSTSLKNSLANIYTQDESSGTLRYSKLSGILTLDLDRKLKSIFFRMYSMDSFQLMFECELYYGFQKNYRPVNQTLWAFDFLQGIILFQFPTHGQAQEMQTAVNKHSHKMDQYAKVLQDRKKEEQAQKKEGTWLGKFKNFFKPEEKHEATKILSVRKENSITFDNATGRFDNIPPQFLEFFAKAGFSAKDLQDKETAQALIEEILVFQTVKEAASDPNATALRQTVKNLNLDVNTYAEINKLPPPPSGMLPPPPPIGKPSQGTGGKSQSTQERGGLLKQIQAGNFKLKPVTSEGGKVTVDLSAMDKDQKKDLSDHLILKMALKKRNKALMRNQEDDDD